MWRGNHKNQLCTVQIYLQIKKKKSKNTLSQLLYLSITNNNSYDVQNNKTIMTQPPSLVW
jgi:hypothetical protein